MSEEEVDLGHVGPEGLEGADAGARRHAADDHVGLLHPCDYLRGQRKMRQGRRARVASEGWGASSDLGWVARVWDKRSRLFIWVAGVSGQVVRKCRLWPVNTTRTQDSATSESLVVSCS